MRHGILFVISAPSGGGKSTLLKALAVDRDFTYSVSCTTRAPRPGEVEGRDYQFLTVEEFERRVKTGQFLEHATVHGNYYGTLRESVLKQLARGHDVLMDVDIQGAAQIRANTGQRLPGAEWHLAEALVDIFLMPPSMKELERRLRGRATETRKQIALRLKNAKDEMGHWREYRYTIVSGKPAEDFDNFRSIMSAERMRSSRMEIKL
jgi:guanylate kinase